MKHKLGRMIVRGIGALFELSVVVTFFTFTLYMYAHILEKVFYIDIPNISSVSRTALPPRIWKLADASLPQNDTEKYGFYGQPQSVKLARLGVALNLQDAKKDKMKDEWLVSDGLASYTVFSPSQSGRLGNTVVYGPNNAKILDVLYYLVEGDRIAIETRDHWRLHYRVKRKIALSSEQDFVPSTGSQSVLILTKEVGPETVIVVEAQFMNVEEIL
jgi:hypothetical protein